VAYVHGVGLFAVSGVLEGFYGQPWTWDEREAVMTRCVAAGLDWYVWGPKSDPLHRKAWREPFSEEHLDGFRQLVALDGLHLGVALAPGLSPGTSVADDVSALFNKLSPVLEIGAELVMIAFDDLEPDLADGARHAEIISALMEHCTAFPELRWVAIPVHYAAVTSTDYLSAFSGGLPPDVFIGWTGPLVVNETLSAVDAERFSDAVDGRPLLLWDNYPVNDAVMADRVFLHPATGRDPLLSEFCAAYLANAGVQAWLSLPALLGAGAYVTTGVSEAKWDDLEDPVNVALLAQACDGRELYRLAETAISTGEADDLWWWLERIEELDVAGPLGEQAEPWIMQAQAEAEVSLLALDLFEREHDDDEIAGLVFSLWKRWPVVRRGTKTVFGSRFALEPTIGTDAAGEWKLGRSSVVEDRNVTDLLCRAALARHTRDTSSGSSAL
jgi:beta-N-acetylglucosaminidase